MIKPPSITGAYAEASADLDRLIAAARPIAETHGSPEAAFWIASGLLDEPMWTPKMLASVLGAAVTRAAQADAQPGEIAAREMTERIAQYDDLVTELLATARSMASAAPAGMRAAVERDAYRLAALRTGEGQ